ncbi:tetratricopeptide repeat protein [Muricoccus roseus]|uniref:tetratricopeptide repeat protein n=1 Tax=Muricoccus roseus TaxID=198092 RepID=UPI000932D53B|nr:tetratricopeptide repeat protein [Roseomonas rosea]
MVETLYEDSELVVRAVPGDASLPTVVTFGGYSRRPAEHGIWAGDPIARMGWPAIGFVAQRPNWYPAASMRAAAERLRGRIGPEAFGYGYSMGAYAVLKYGRLLGLSHALALSPQFSIAPEDVPEDGRFHISHDPALHAGMRVTAGEVPPRAWMLFDPLHALDARNIALLAPLGPVPVPVRGMFHATIRLLTGQAVLAEVLDTLRRDDLPAFRRIMRTRRHETPFWFAGMGAALLTRGRAKAGNVLLDEALSRGLDADTEVGVLGEAMESWTRLQAPPDVTKPPEALVERLLNSTPHTPHAHLDRSLKLAGIGRLAESRRAAEQAMEAGQAPPALMTHLGHLLLMEGQPSRARTVLEEATRLAPEGDWGWVGLSIARLRQGDGEGAADAARQALALRPLGFHGALALGDALLVLGRTEEAAEAFARASASGGAEGAAHGLARVERARKRDARVEPPVPVPPVPESPGGREPVPAGPPAMAQAPAGRDPVRDTAARIAGGYPDPALAMPRRRVSLLKRLFGRPF